MAGVVARHTKMCTSVFLFIPQGNEKNQQSILKTMSKPLGNFTENAAISNFHNLISSQIQKF